MNDNLVIEELEEVLDTQEEEPEIENEPAKDAEEIEGETEIETSEEREAEEEAKPEAESDDDGILFDFGTDDSEPEPETSAIKQVRNAYKKQSKGRKEAERRIAELERQLAEVNQPKSAEISKKPDLEDFDYDQEAFTEAVITWNAQKQEVENQKAKQREQEQAAEQAWLDRQSAYEATKAKVKNDDFDMVESDVKEHLNPNQQGMIISLSDDPARDVYYLGKHPEVLKRLAEIQDPGKFIYELAKLQNSKGKTMAKKPAPPEKRVVGTAPRGKGSEAKLNKLREEAARTGDRTKVVQYRKTHGL